MRYFIRTESYLVFSPNSRKELENYEFNQYIYNTSTYTKYQPFEGMHNKPLIVL